MNHRRYSMKFALMAAVALALTAAMTTASAQTGKRAWSFDQDPVGKMPQGFASALTGRGTIGQWSVTKDDSAPSPPNVLAQTSADKTDYRFPLTIAEDTNYKDLALSVKFKTISGEVDQGAGLVFRLKDKDNYYVTRANALEDNFRLYHVVRGRRVQFAGANFKVTSNAWHEIKVEARGNEFKCFYDGQLKITAKDDTFKDAGKIGLWTKADSVIHFDDLTVEDLGGAKSSASQAKIVAQKLVDELVAKYPDLVRIGLHLTPPNHADNIIVACNIAARIGQKSDPEDLKVMRTGKPVVLREEGNFDITLPLHTASGKVIGAVGLTFKPQAGEQDSRAVERARKMAAELEKQAASKAKLFESVG
jgi:3-keto-disaccharide hydrolase